MVSTTRTARSARPALVAAALLAGLATVAPAAGAVGAAGAADPQPGPFAPEAWQPTTQTAFSAPAGRYCSFGFTYTPDRQDLQQRVTRRYPDGSVAEEQFRGLLVGTFTNDETGASVQRNSSGFATEDLRPDGSLATYTMQGPVGLGFRAGDAYPQGYYELSGYHVVSFAPDGTRTMSVDRGTEEDLCDVLG